MRKGRKYYFVERVVSILLAMRSGRFRVKG